MQIHLVLVDGVRFAYAKVIHLDDEEDLFRMIEIVDYILIKEYNINIYRSKQMLWFKDWPGKIHKQIEENDHIVENEKQFFYFDGDFVKGDFIKQNNTR